MGDTIVSASKEESSVPEVHIPSYTRTTGVLSTRPEPARQLSCARGPASCRPPPNPHPPLSPLSAPPPCPGVVYVLSTFQTVSHHLLCLLVRIHSESSKDPESHPKSC